MAVVLAVAMTAAALATRDGWSRWLPTHSPAEPVAAAPPPAADVQVLKLSAQARKNLALVSKPVIAQTYWRTLQIPGEIVDRPGISDRGVTAPAVGVVEAIHVFPGDTVAIGERVITLRLSSEYLQNSQTELFRASREAELVGERRARLESAVRTGAVPEARLIELDNELRRQTAAIQAFRQDLLTRGLSSSQIDAAARGSFVSTIDVVAPPVDQSAIHVPEIEPTSFVLSSTAGDSAAYEVEDLAVTLGQQVQAGQLLCTLADHRLLYIEGHAFKQEAPFIEQAARQKWAIGVEFAEDDLQSWPTLEQTFHIRHLANTMDPVNRTFDFFIPLTNPSRAYTEDGETFVVWRFRPGQRVRLDVPVEEMRDVLVLPAAAVVREGPEAYVFRQNGDLFDRLPVHVLHEDRSHVVLANDGSVRPGWYMAQGGASALNRVLKAQAASGTPANVHVHADGTVHAAH